MPLIAGFEVRDFANKCGGSIFKVNGELFFMEGLSPPNEDDDGFQEDVHSIAGSTIFSSQPNRFSWAGIEIPLNEMAAATIDFTYPQVGYVNFKKGAVYMQRRVERQWKVGFHHRTVAFFDRFSREREALGISLVIRSLHSSAEFVKRAYDRFYYSHDRAIAMIRNGERLGAAISPYIYIGQSLNFDNLLICYKDIPIGYIDSDDNKFIFKEAEYVRKLLPFDVEIREVTGVD